MMYQGFNEGIARLEYPKSTRGIGVITGEPGAGKTSLFKAFYSFFKLFPV